MKYIEINGARVHNLKNISSYSKGRTGGPGRLRDEEQVAEPVAFTGDVWRSVSGGVDIMKSFPKISTSPSNRRSY